MNGDLVNVWRAYAGLQFSTDEIDPFSSCHHDGSGTRSHRMAAYHSPSSTLEEKDIGIETIPRHGVREVAGLWGVESLEKDVLVDTACHQDAIGIYIDSTSSSKKHFLTLAVHRSRHCDLGLSVALPVQKEESWTISILRHIPAPDIVSALRETTDWLHQTHCLRLLSCPSMRELVQVEGVQAILAPDKESATL